MNSRRADRRRTRGLFAGSLALLLGSTSTMASPPPVGPDGRFGLADVLACYAVARRLPDAPYDAACDDDEDGRVGVAEALVWYGLFTRVAPGIVGADPGGALPGGEITLTVTNVARADNGVVAELFVNGQTLEMPVVRVDGPTLVVRVPEEAPEVERAFVRLRRDRVPGNRWAVRLGAPEIRLEGGIVSSGGVMEGPTWRLVGHIDMGLPGGVMEGPTYRLEGAATVMRATAE